LWFPASKSRREYETFEGDEEKLSECDDIATAGMSSDEKTKKILINTAQSFFSQKYNLTS